MMIDSNGRLTNWNLYCNVMHLPILAMLQDGNQIVIDTMTDSQITDMYELISSAAMNGDGFGVDEYPTEKDFRNEIKDGHNFIVSSKECGKIIAAFSLINSKFYRGTDMTFADLIIIVKKSERGKGIGELLVRNIIWITKRLGFLGMFTDTFCNNVAMTKIIERIPGYQQVGHLPVGGKMPDGTIVGTNIYFKDLRNITDDSTLWIPSE